MIFLFSGKEIKKGFFDYYLECSKKQAMDLIQKLKLYSLRLDVDFKKENLFVVVSNFLPKNINSKKDIRFSHNEIYRSYLIIMRQKTLILLITHQMLTGITT